MNTGEQNERVYITADSAVDADRYHRHPDRCPPVANLELTEITLEDTRDNCTLCKNCNQIDKQAQGRTLPTHGLARQLAAMNVDEVLGGDPA